MRKNWQSSSTEKKDVQVLLDQSLKQVKKLIQVTSAIQLKKDLSYAQVHE